MKQSCKGKQKSVKFVDTISQEFQIIHYLYSLLFNSYVFTEHWVCVIFDLKNLTVLSEKLKWKQKQYIEGKYK